MSDGNEERYTTFEEVVDWMEGKTKKLNIYQKKEKVKQT